MTDFSFIQKIQAALQAALPGQEAQFKMAHTFRKEASSIVPTNAKEAAVMLLLFLKNNAWHTVLIQRSAAENDQHSGQVSFPGGKKEVSDISHDYCAKRETFEEVGVPSDLIQILGKLTPLYIPVSNFHVFPFVGFVEKEPVWSKQMSEVSEIIQVPITHFLLEENKGTTTVNGKGFSLENTPYFNVNGKVVWGATAMILSEFCEIQANF
jgi:8-oxo-dGTP pyrophosphatase MutT (NUDIX family)